MRAQSGRSPPPVAHPVTKGYRALPPDCPTHPAPSICPAPTLREGGYGRVAGGRTVVVASLFARGPRPSSAPRNRHAASVPRKVRRAAGLRIRSSRNGCAAAQARTGCRWLRAEILRMIVAASPPRSECEASRFGSAQRPAATPPRERPLEHGSSTGASLAVSSRARSAALPGGLCSCVMLRA